ncbi:hypothetical protein MLD38_003436 [Melastoma candidum]|uniref:Uncharacterized protein n=1 Tax=Melastoma candidum TaxID=119954 RepID=A0ACB9S2F8_9MYRT|nr:hypothetical protein MLD38_003436 [Melastoma candidum]
MVGRPLTSISRGVVADKYGQKPVVFWLLPMSQNVRSHQRIEFFMKDEHKFFQQYYSYGGLPHSLWPKHFWMALSMRFLLGCFGCLLGTIRAYATEVCRDEDRALSLSVVSTSRGIGLIIGPANGENYLGLFSKESIFGRFPTSCLAYSYQISQLEFVSCWQLPVSPLTGISVLLNNAVVRSATRTEAR